MKTKHEIALINRHYREINPLDFGEEACAPGHTYGPAIRRYTLIHFVISGKGIFNNGDGIHHLHAGEAFVIHPGEVTVYSAVRTTHGTTFGSASTVPFRTGLTSCLA